MEIYQPGSMIGNYEVVSKPMMGGMGVVYFCLDHRNDKKPVALKTFKPEFLPNRDARDRFLREGTAWINLGSHPHIVRCYKVEYMDPTPFLSLELIAKEQEMEDASLRAWIGAPMKVDQVLLFALQIVRGLQHATTKIPGFVHRDLKPENVLVGADKLPGTNINRLRVTDFGLATMLKDEGERLTKEEGKQEIGRTHLTRGILGTPLYMAPEQWEGEDVGAYTDVYALGCILFEMLTAKRVVEGRSVNDLRSAHCEGRLASVPESMSKEMRILLRRCLSLHPAERFQRWEELTQDLESVYALQMGRAAPAEVPNPQADNNERIQDGWSYNAIGRAYRDVEKAEVSKSYFEKSLLIAREIGDRHGEGTALGNLGIGYEDLGEVRRAIEYYEQALAILREVGDHHGTSAALGNLGNAYYSLGEVRHAIRYYEQDLTIDREVENRRGESVVLGNLGMAYAHLGELQRAIEYYEQAVVIDREIGNRRAESAVLGNLGNAYANLGEVRRAIGYYEQALTIGSKIGDRRREGNTLSDLGLAHERLGEVRRAIGYYEQALVIGREIEDRRVEGSALGNLGNAYIRLGELWRAIGYFEEALAILRKIEDRRGEGAALEGLGNAYYSLDEVRRAIGYYEQALVIGREIEDRRGEGNALGNLGIAYTRLGEVQRAIGYYEEAIAIRREIGDLNGVATDSFNMGVLYSKQGETSYARSLVLEAERIFAQIGSPNVQAAQQLIAQLGNNQNPGLLDRLFGKK